jgi:CHASE2 domain-containing sensor protein
MIAGIILVVAVPLALGALAGWDSDGFRPRHFLLGFGIGAALVAGAAAVMLIDSRPLQIAAPLALLIAVSVFTVRASRANRDPNPEHFHLSWRLPWRR